MARTQRFRSALPLAALVVFVSGSQTAMSAETRFMQPPPETYETPLPFMRHSFAAYCYNTLSCSVVYDGHEFTPYDIDEPAGPPKTPDYRDIWSGGHLDIRNFPGPVLVRWTSLDGIQHATSIDLAKLFKDHLVWHKVSRTDLRPFYTGPSVPGGPEIVVEVNDRTVNVYSSMFIPTRAEQRPGHVHSNFRDDRFLVWSHAD